MKIEFYTEGSQPRVKVEGKWNSLSLFIESDSSFADVKKHIELKKQKPWIGNTSTIKPASGSKYEIFSELDPELETVVIFRKQLLDLINEWEQFKFDKRHRELDL